MRIAIVGTSNSLRRDGYVSYLKLDKRVEAIDNYSIGASTGLHSIRTTASIEFSQYEFCLIDFSVNEEVVRKNGALNLVLAREIVDSLVVRCIAAGCVPVITLLPRLVDTPKARMREFYLRVAAEWQLPFFDGYELVDQIQRASDITKFAIFGDPAHIRPWACAVFARTLADGLSSLPPERERRFIARHVEAPRFGAAPIAAHLADWTGLHSVERASSRSSGTFVRSEAPSVLRLEQLDATEAIGLCLNLTESYCVVRVAGRNEAALDVRSLYFGNPAFRLVISVLPLMQLVGCENGRIEIQSLDADGAVQVAAVSELPSELGRTKAPPTGQIEIADLFVRRQGSVSAMQVPSEDMHVNLLSSKSFPIVETAAHVYRSLFTRVQDQEAEQQMRDSAREKRRKKRAGGMAL